MLALRVDLQFLDHRVAERALRQHALDRDLQRAARKAVVHLAEAGLVHAARIAAVAVVDLVLFLAAGHAQLGSIDDDDEVTGVDVGRVLGLVLAAQTQRNLARKAPQHLVAGVDEQPVALDFVVLGRKGLHGIHPGKGASAPCRQPICGASCTAASSTDRTPRGPEWPSCKAERRKSLPPAASAREALNSIRSRGCDASHKKNWPGPEGPGRIHLKEGGGDIGWAPK